MRLTPNNTLQPYRNLFRALEQSGVRYTVFKSIEHIEQDLLGCRGDIDMLVHCEDVTKLVESAQTNGFILFSKRDIRKNIFFMVGWDSDQDKLLILHLHTQPVLVRKRRFFFLTFLYPFDNELLNCPKGSEINIAPSEWVEKFEADRQDAKPKINKNAFVLLIELLRSDFRPFKLSWFASVKQTITQISTMLRIKILGTRNRKKGLLFAFIGVDGAGKTSLLQDLCESPFLASEFAVKKIYFGCNDYIIPGLNYLYSKKVNNMFVNAIATCDQKTRLIPALWHIALGRIVLADRYFYDARVHYHGSNSVIRKIYGKFSSFMPVKPDATFYLQVRPEVAYERKQDYDYDTMVINCERYNDVMLKEKNVVIIDANQTSSAVNQQVRSKIRDYLTEHLRCDV